MADETQKAAEDKIKSCIVGGGPFVAALERTRMPTVLTDPNVEGNPIVWANAAFLELTGYDLDEVLERSYHFMMGPATDPDAQAEIEEAFRKDSLENYPEVCYHRKDGSTFWATIFIGLVKDPGGAGDEDGQHFASFIDVTRRKQDEERLKLLVEELDHRVKNTLATVQSIAALTLRNSRIDDDVRQAFEGRLMALARTHSLLSREKWQRVRLVELIELILEPYKGGGTELAVSGDDVRLSSRAILSMGLLFQELATNAAKHGALAEGGEIAISWRETGRPEARRLELIWRERRRTRLDPPTRRGFGLRLIEQAVAHELNGSARLRFEQSGLVCEVEVPLDDGVAAKAAGAEAGAPFEGRSGGATDARDEGHTGDARR